VPEQQKTREIDELIKKLSALKEQKYKIDAEANDLAEKRNTLNQQFKNLLSEIRELKNERDRLNEVVKELKLQRENTRKEIREKIEETRKLNEKIKMLDQRKPSRSFQNLQEEIENIDWEIQTIPIDLNEEKHLVERVKELETQLSIYRKLEQLKQNTMGLRAEIRALENRGKLFHEKLTETAKNSQEIHERMLKKIDESKRLKEEADSLHKAFLQVKEKTRPLQDEMTEISNKISLLKQKIREGEEKERKKTEEALREKLEKQAREKLRRGEKLTWEEFQLLAEKGISTQD